MNIFHFLKSTPEHDLYAEDTQFVAEVVETRMEAYRTEFGRSPTVRTAATVTRNLCYSNKDQLSTGLICAGWDARNGGSVFSIPQVRCLPPAAVLW